MLKILIKGKKLSLCRCWRSETFPLCDGAHKDYNRRHNDNVGPINIVWDEENEDIEQKTLVEDIQSMNASTELSSLEMIDSNGDNNSNTSAGSGSHRNDENNLIDIYLKYHLFVSNFKIFLFFL